MIKIAPLIFIASLTSTLNATALRCDLIDPRERDADLCWKQLSHGGYPSVAQVLTGAQEEVPVPVSTRNAELSSALMQLYGMGKLNGNKRNPEFSRDVMRFMSDINQYKEG
ncbi:uncharacterized protein [Euwallacea fornicatus]|uniref:uncharacterized protein n=1 Tax=Euwallacea fornicatus TaxID=995702 RepID=UPI0033905051